MKTADRKALEQQRLYWLVSQVAAIKKQLGERLAQSKKLFGRRIYAVDLHTHSTFSDGCGTPADNYECFQNTGLDFLFATDHNTISQKRVVKKWKNVSWGQEPGIGGQDMGLLCGPRTLKPRAPTVAENFEKGRKLAPFVWIAHPAGFGGHAYPENQIAKLWTLGDFAMEVLNGFPFLVRGYSPTDVAAQAEWDRLLSAGRKVTAVAGSDAHVPDSVGCVWTGVGATRCTAPAIIKALSAGHCFASEASLLALTGDGRPMGSTINKKKTSSVKVGFRVADAAGLESVRIISMGKVIKEIAGKGEPIVEGTLTRRCGPKPAYYRLESTASDDRRAFSTPIYIRPA